MQYVIVADSEPDGEALHVDIEPSFGAPGSSSLAQYTVTLGDVCCEVEAAFLPDGSISLCFEGQQHHVYTADNGAQTDGHWLAAEVLDLRRFALRKADNDADSEDGPALVCSPMAGRIARILVQEGEQVQADQALLVVEAMKMENEMRAPKAGRVRNLACAPEEQVELGAQLCCID